MFVPVSALTYKRLNTKAQALVVVCPEGPRAPDAEDRWKDRAVAIVHDSVLAMRDVVRDLLANPQVRAIVFDGDCCCRDAYDRVWLGETPVDWKIDREHLQLVRQFVDLYDDDFGHRGPQQPFWPVRIKYLE